MDRQIMPKTLQMVAVNSCTTPLEFYWTARPYIPENSSLQIKIIFMTKLKAG
jgi:hypothetical protein